MKMSIEALIHKHLLVCKYLSRKIKFLRLSLLKTNLKVLVPINKNNRRYFGF